MMKWEGCEKTDLLSLNLCAVTEGVHNKTPSRGSNSRSTEYEPTVTVAPLRCSALLKFPSTSRIPPHGFPFRDFRIFWLRNNWLYWVPFSSPSTTRRATAEAF
jgi:hypothetical protein